jgi:hypothetical protein
MKVLIPLYYAMVYSIIFLILISTYHPLIIFNSKNLHLLLYHHYFFQILCSIFHLSKFNLFNFKYISEGDFTFQIKKNILYPLSKVSFPIFFYLHILHFILIFNFILSTMNLSLAYMKLYYY